MVVPAQQTTKFKRVRRTGAHLNIEIQMRWCAGTMHRTHNLHFYVLCCLEFDAWLVGTCSLGRHFVQGKFISTIEDNVLSFGWHIPLRSRRPYLLSINHHTERLVVSLTSHGHRNILLQPASAGVDTRDKHFLLAFLDSLNECHDLQPSH